MVERVQEATQETNEVLSHEEELKVGLETALAEKHKVGPRSASRLKAPLPLPISPLSSSVSLE